MTASPLVAPSLSAGGLRQASCMQERWLWARGLCRVAGVDEAGRGALAGPLVAAAVILPPDVDDDDLAGLCDSKLLTAAARERWSQQLHTRDYAIGVGIVSAALLDAIGLSAAGQLAFSRAVAALPTSPDYVLVDAFRLRDNACPQLALIHGDARCASIAAASVVAKVTRDALMDGLHERFPAYAFDRHKGYATTAHRGALAAHGPCLEHRRSYAPVREVAP
jgi:ribonuclease HII